jgi:hypothetical protein
MAKKKSHILALCLESLLISAACFAVGIVINLSLHPEPIPLVAQTAYQTMVPCPEPGGPVTALSAAEALSKRTRSFVVDARMTDEHARWHVPGAMNVTYDYLDPTPPALIKKLAKKAAASGAQRVVVYGDGDHPDSGEQLGKELSASGIKNVCFVKGGAKALKKKLGADQ